MVKKEDFFTEENCVSYVSEDEYARLSLFLEAFDAIARTTYKSIYIIDYYRQNFLYVSNNLFYLCGMKAEQVQAMGYDFYLKFTPKSEHRLLLEANRSGFQFASTVPSEQLNEYVISYDFHICPPGKVPTLINHKITPLKMTPDGKRVWLVLCVASLSAASKAGNIEVSRLGDEALWTYKNRQWTKERSILTKREKEVMSLLVRGNTTKEIAAKLNRSEDTIKLYRKKIFAKLNIRNKSTAVLAAINRRMV